MATSSASKKETSGKTKQLTQEQIINGFNELRAQQRQLAAKVQELTDERKEHQ